MSIDFKLIDNEETFFQISRSFANGDYSRFLEVTEIAKTKYFENFETVLSSFGVYRTKESDFLQGFILGQIWAQTTSATLEDQAKYACRKDYTWLGVMPRVEFNYILNKLGVLTDEQARKFQMLANAMGPFLKEKDIYRLLQLNLIVSPELAPEFHKSFHCLLMKRLYKSYGDKAYESLCSIRRIMIHLVTSLSILSQN